MCGGWDDQDSLYGIARKVEDVGWVGYNNQGQDAILTYASAIGRVKWKHPLTLIALSFKPMTGGVLYAL